LQEFTPAQMQIITVGSITTNSPVAIGHDIIQNVTQ